MYDFPKNFIDAIKSKECIFFIGSGISTWSGFPTWYKLIDDMIGFLQDRGLGKEEVNEIKDALSQGELLSAANLCSSCMRKEDFQVFVDNEFRRELKLHEVQKIIVDLGVDSFITTNYDKLIETAYLKCHDINLHLVNNNQPSEHAKIVKAGSSRFIFKPHGDADDSGTIILSTRDYRKIEYDLQSVVSTMACLMISRPIVYVGFGLKDPDFLMIKDKISSTYKGGEREHFAIFPSIGRLHKSYFREEYGINIISYDINEKNMIDDDGKHYKIKSHEQLIELLNDLHSVIHDDIDQKSIEDTNKTEINFLSYLRNSIVRYCEEVKHKNLHDESCMINLNVNINKVGSNDFKENTTKEKWTLVNSIRNVDIFEALDKIESMIIIGPPGAGKTYSMQMYSTILADRTLNIFNNNQVVSNAELKHSIPVILSMKEYNGDITQMIIERLPRSIDIEVALKCEYLVLFFDAIDEVSRKFIDDDIFTSDLENFIGKYSGNRFIFTSRALTYISPMKLPVFDIEPLPIDSKEFIVFLKEKFGISQEQMDTQTKTILKNPFFLSLFSKIHESKKKKEFNVVDLLEEYLLQIDNRLAEETGIMDISIKQILGPICFETINNGMKTIHLKSIVEFSRKVFSSYPHISEKIPHILINMGILVFDSEGNLGFIHQTVLEYLAALQLADMYEVNSNILEEKIAFFNWDETIMIFLNLISKDNIKRVLDKISKKDINFACKAFNFSAIKTEELGMELFDFIYEKANDSSTLPFEKNQLKSAMMLLVPYGNKEKLISLLDDENMSGGAAIFLAKLKVKEAISKIIKLLVEDYTWPSDFAKALICYEDETISFELLNFVKNLDDDLLIMNITDVLVEYESEELYKEIINFSKSDKTIERKLLVEFMEKIDSDYSNNILETMLDDQNSDIVWEVIFSLEGCFGRTGKKNSKIVYKMFNLLKDKHVGYVAAEYLYKMFDDNIYREALRRLITSCDSNEKINLYHVIAKNEREIVEKELISFLDNYDVGFHDSLFRALSALDINKVFPILYQHLKSDNDLVIRSTILQAIEYGLRSDELLNINKEQCEYLVNLWENSNTNSERQSIRIILTRNCKYISKDFVIARFNNPEYVLRGQLTDIVVRYPLSKEDFTGESIEWLISNISVKYEPWNPIAHILGEICGEELVKEKLIPLLQSDDENIRNSLCIAISYAERKLGRRFR